jgi:lipoprotein-anchoring transpeptidase ErfK/SrfK
LIVASALRKNKGPGDVFGLGEMTVRPALSGTSMVLAASVAVLLATAAPARALEYERGFLFLRQPVQPVVDPRANSASPEAQRASKAARRKQFVKEAGKREAEKLPSGPLQIMISIKKQQLTLYAGGHAVAHSPVSTGVPGHPTPQGVFSVIEKQIYHESNLYSSAPMPYMQRITWSGVALHQGVVPGHPASHGCIRLPAAFAKRLWGITKVGARVIIAQDDIVLSEISNKRLFTALPQTVGEAPMATRLRYADNSGVTDMPLKGSIDAGAEARIERSIDEVAQQGAIEAGTTTSASGLSRSEESRVERLIDQAALAGIEELTTGSVTLSAAEQLPPAFEKAEPGATAKDPMLRPGPISVFISRKLGKLFVRKGFAEVFEAPVSIARPDEPLGTHVFTALEARSDGTMRWNVASLATDHLVKKGKYQMTLTARGEKLRKELSPPAHQVMLPGDPNAALERITISEDALGRITELMTPGASLIISDLGQSYETGRGTDFIVLTR